MTILGLDLSLSSSGRCIFSNNKVIAYGKITTKKQDFENDLDRFKYIADEVQEIINKHEIDFAVIEDSVPAKKSRSVMQLNIIKGEVIRTLTLNLIPVGLLYPSTVKKLVTGNGKSSKEEVAQYIRENYIDCGEYNDKPSKSKTSDIYDAIAIAIAWNNK